MKYTIALTARQWGALAGCTAASLDHLRRAKGSRQLSPGEADIEDAISSALDEIHKIMGALDGRSDKN